MFGVCGDEGEGGEAGEGELLTVKTKLIVVN